MIDFSKGVRGKYHDCDRVLNRTYPSHAQAQDGERWRCTCGNEFEHVCDEAEGCSWIPYVQPCQGCAKKIDHYCWERSGQFWAGDSAASRARRGEGVKG